MLKLCQDRRGRQKNLTYVGSRAMLVYELPLNEVVFDFYDRLKSISRGYASFDYQIKRLRGGRPRQDVDPGQRRAGRRALHHRAPRARREPRPGHVREAQGADPAAHVPDPDPGGDRRRASSRARPSARCARTCSPSATAATSRSKRKLLEKQKKGKKKMRQFGQVEIPQEAFIAALKMDENSGNYRLAFMGQKRLSRRPADLTRMRCARA